MYWILAWELPKAERLYKDETLRLRTQLSQLFSGLTPSSSFNFRLENKHSLDPISNFIGTPG